MSSSSAIGLSSPHPEADRMSMTEVITAFAYEPLEPERMRLLRLHPGEGQAELQGTLVSVTLQEASHHHYQALSYAWGKERWKRHRILLNSSVQDRPERGDDGYFGIAPSLYEALRQLRDAESPRYLWADAVCINQADNDEVNAQVQQMYAIYSRAQCTIIWLGPEANRRAFSFVLEQSDFFGSANCLSIEPLVDDGTSLTEGSSSDEYWPRRFALDHYPRFEDCTREDFDLWHRNHFNGFLELLTESEWFERAWVFQESVASRRKVIQQGALAIPWDSFSDACRAVREKRHDKRSKLFVKHWVKFVKQPTGRRGADEGPLYPAPNQPVPQRAHFRVLDLVQKMDDARSVMDNPGQLLGGNSQMKSQRRPLLRNLLPVTRQMKSTLSRDKVFSLLNVDDEFRSQEGFRGEVVQKWTATRQSRGFPRIDYAATKTDEDVCVEVAQYWLASMSNRGGNRLVFLQHVQEQHRDSQWPSWLPDWSMVHRAGMLCRELHSHGSKNFSASGKSQVVATIDYVHDALRLREIPILRACGVRFDELKIMALEHPPRSGGMFDELLGKFRKRKYPRPPLPYQKAVNELANLVKAPYAGDASRENTMPKQDTVFDATKLLNNGAYRDEDGFIRRFFVSKDGYIGLAPLGARESDEICILFGAKTPMAIRNRGEYYEFVGECLVYGIMNGELMDGLDGNKIENLAFR